MEVTIPDIGDAEDVEVIEICVTPGESVAANDALIVIESDKASMEVPAPFAGALSRFGGPFAASRRERSRHSASFSPR